MNNRQIKEFYESLLEKANIQVNGSNPWDLQLYNEGLYEKVIKQNSLGLGEAYMDNWWDCSQIDEFFYRLLMAKLDEYPFKKLLRNKEGLLFSLRFVFYKLQHRIFNYQNRDKAFEIGEQHYDIGNDLFQCMLDKELSYSCGYWKNAKDLDAAQENKLRLICDKIGLKSGQRVLDIGCGWGSFARFAAKNYNASVVGITVSQQQKILTDKLCSGLPIEVRLQDYRDVDEKFDHIISIGMFEHVGHKNYRDYMQTVARCLKDDGLFVLHTIGANKTSCDVDEWINKYIFPNSKIPSARQITAAYEHFFVMEDWHNFGADYDKTLMAWHQNFNQNWNCLRNSYSERFRRMWNYYLLSCAGTFRARYLQLWQIVLSKNGCSSGYRSIR